MRRSRRRAVFRGWASRAWAMAIARWAVGRRAGGLLRLPGLLGQHELGRPRRAVRRDPADAVIAPELHVLLRDVDEVAGPLAVVGAAAYLRLVPGPKRHAQPHGVCTSMVGSRR